MVHSASDAGNLGFLCYNSGCSDRLGGQKVVEEIIAG
jgi:hypothetical protein